MNPKTFGVSIWLLLFGTASVLLIGAFASFDGNGPPDGAATNPPAQPPAAARADFSEPAAPPAVTSAGMPALPADLSPGLAEIIKLAQAHIGDDTILAYIQNSGQTYNPSADEILYLSDLGVSDKVVAALVKKPDAAPAPDLVSAPDAVPAPAAAPGAAPAPETPPAPSPANAGMAGALDDVVDAPPAAAEEEAPPLQNPQDSYFYDSLAPYGNWVQTGAGWGWQPMAAAADSGWAPYRNHGCWMLTDDGWYWASDYSWGWAPFHYGRWSHDGPFGWVWAPGNDWAPAWVAWRNTTDGFAGWAALPPGVHFRSGMGLVAGAGLGGWKASYGLSAASFTFVPQQHFLARNVGRFAVAAPRAAALFQSSIPVNNYSFSGRRILNNGVSAGQIAAAMKTPVPKYTMQDAASPDTSGRKIAGKSLAVYRPDAAAPVARPSVEAQARPVLINKTPRPAAAETPNARAVPTKPATVASDYSFQAPRPSYTASPARPSFISGNFQPQTVRTAPSSAAPAAPAAGRVSQTGGVAASRNPAPNGPASAAGYPSYTPRGFNSASSAAQGNASSINPPQRNAANSAPAYSPPATAAPRSPAYSAPANSAPAYSPPAAAPPHSAPAAAPAESHSGGGQSSQGSGSTGSSSASGSSRSSR